VTNFNFPGLLLVHSMMQNFINVLQVSKEAFFKYEDENKLKICMKALLLAKYESQRDLQDLANQVIKETIDDPFVTLRLVIT
jgi:hypothetical protein